MPRSKAHKEASVPEKSRFDFDSHDAWLAYVATELPASDRPYARASARTELFRRLYQSLRAPFPNRFGEEVERINRERDPQRTAALQTLNDTIFGHLIAHVFNRAQRGTSENQPQEVASPREQIQDLLHHLAINNPYFVLWLAYKEGVDNHRITENWNEYLVLKLGAGKTDAVAFTQAMAELGTLLHHFHDKRLRLPNHCIGRIWFLHLLRGPERMAQTRAVLGMLTAELGACTSA